MQGHSMSLESMEAVFARSQAEHQASMAQIMQKMSLQQAVKELHKHNLTNSALSNITRGLTSKLRKQPTGYGGIDGARKLLNDMIYESMSKYDEEIAKCTEYYASQCAAMEICRGEIAASNFIAANSRALILDSQATINKCEVDIPTTKLVLKQHNLKCAHELSKLNARLKIVMGDIAVMTTILEMTDCEKALYQAGGISMMKCKDACSKKTWVKFNHKDLQKKVSQLQASSSKKLFQDSFTDLTSGIESLESIEMIQVNSWQVPNKTEFNNPPTPRTEVPGNPCNDPDMGAPSQADKRAAKCTISRGPQCYKLQERFLAIQGGIQDERDQLLEEIESMEESCEDSKKQLETKIENDADMLANAQTKLAQATEKEANAGESARQTAAKHDSLDKDLLKVMKTCSGNYITFETEICALKKIRGELYKMKGSGHSAFFQDCELSKWEPEECSKSCASGDQKLTRSVLTHPDGGVKCLPLEAEKSCNNNPCPVDCNLMTWSGWSKCSAECGGGVTQRLREVKQAAKYGGHPCGETSETKSCNNQACEKDCTLSDWTTWSECTKDCDGGTRKRQKFVKEEAEGAGKCADEWSMKRLEYKQCNMDRCFTAGPEVPLGCNRSLDVIILLDGRASLKKEGWEQEVKAAKHLVSSLSVSEGKAEIAIFVYAGPRTWSGVEQCTGKTTKTVENSEEICGPKTVSHFTNEYKKLNDLLTGLEWPKGGTLTSLALLKAKSELALGRPDSHSIVVCFTAGGPLSYRKTQLAARSLRKSARLLWVPISKHTPLKFFKQAATRRWQENLVPVEEVEHLGNAETVTHIVANICPDETPSIEFETRPTLD